MQHTIEQLAKSCHTLAATIPNSRSQASINLWELDRAIEQLKGELQKLRQATSERQVDYSMFLVVNHVVGLVDRLAQYMHVAVEIAQSSHDRQPRRRSQSTTVKMEWNRPRVLEILRDNLTLNSAVFRHALRLGVTTAVAVTICSIFGLKQGYWVSLTVVVILKPYSGATFQRGLQRVLGHCWRRHISGDSGSKDS